MKTINRFLMAAICLAALLTQSSCRGKDADPKAIIWDDYYDYSTQSSETFLYQGDRYHCFDVHALSREQYQLFAETECQCVYLSWDKANDVVIVSRDKESSSSMYFMLEHPYDAQMILLIPPHENNLQLFEISRPLAFPIIRSVNE